MNVSKDVFNSVEIGDYVWQYYLDNGPKIGKSFVRGKEIGNRYSYNTDEDDNNPEQYSIQLSKRFNNSNDELYLNESDAIVKYIEELEKKKVFIEKSLNSINELLVNTKENFDKMTDESLSTSTRDTADGMMCMFAMFDEDEDSNFHISVDNIPEIEFTVGEKVYSALNLKASDIFGHKSDNYKVIDDVVTSVEVMFRKPDNIEVLYRTKYDSKNYMRGLKLFKTKEEAEKYCLSDANNMIDVLKEKIGSIEYTTADEKTEDPISIALSE